MIVGTPSSMKELAQQLLDASNREIVAETAPWPLAIATPPVIGPYKDIRKFTLSFHLQGSAPVEKVAPLKRRTLWPPLFFLIALLTIVGAVNVWRWILSILV